MADVRQCIRHYKNPDSLCDCVRYLFYRIKNAILSIFGNSEWQKCLSIIKENSIQLAREKGLWIDDLDSIDTPEEDKRMRRVTISKIQKAVDTACYPLLPMCLSMENKDPYPTEKIKAVVAKYNIERFLVKIQQAQQEFFPVSAVG